MNVFVIVLIVILSIIGIYGIIYISAESAADCNSKNGSSSKITYKFSPWSLSCVPDGCMPGYGPLTKDKTCPDSTDCSKKDGTADHVSAYKYDGTKCVPVDCLPTYGPLTPDGTCPDPCNDVNVTLKNDVMNLNFNDDSAQLEIESSICNPYLKFYFDGSEQAKTVVDKKVSDYDLEDVGQQDHIDLYRFFVDQINKFNSTSPNKTRTLRYLI